ncbi:hypothetical protein [uncultured Sphingomonas sp.]|jgi:hypothetical protein|uniref:hypothetical protein n=1 Tax=uncultured Sphingomonas sp. TaxID=158754 RepID=UPI0035C966EF
MDEPYDADDERLEQRQGAALYPLGRALRSTYDADNHETLSAEVTALMINLSRVPYEPCAKAPVAVAAAQPERAERVVRSLRSRVFTLFGG